MFSIDELYRNSFLLMFGTGISSIGVHNLSPGLVLTDLLLKDSTPVARRFFNTLAEEPDTAATILAPQIRSVQGSKQSLEVLSPLSAVLKVVTGFPQIISGGRFFDKEGNRVAVTGKRYKDNGVEVLFWMVHYVSDEGEAHRLDWQLCFITIKIHPWSCPVQSSEQMLDRLEMNWHDGHRRWANDCQKHAWTKSWGI